MNRARKTPHLNPLPASGARQNPFFPVFHESSSQSQVVFSLCLSPGNATGRSAERIKMRDCLGNAPRAPTRSPAKHHRVLHGFGDSRNATLRSLFWLGTLHEVGRGLDPRSSCVRLHQARRPVLPPDNRNPRCTAQSGVDGEICIPRKYGCADGAKEFARHPLPFSEESWHDSQQIYLSELLHFREAKFTTRGNRSPLTSVLSPQAGRGRPKNPACRGHINAAMRTAHLTNYHALFPRSQICLSLSQRERIKVRDCSDRNIPPRIASITRNRTETSPGRN
jgi:hypothetical protein